MCTGLLPPGAKPIAVKILIIIIIIINQTQLKTYMKKNLKWLTSQSYIVYISVVVFRRKLVSEKLVKIIFKVHITTAYYNVWYVFM